MLRHLTLEKLSIGHRQASGTAKGTGVNAEDSIHPFSRAERHPVKGHGCKGLPGSNLWEVGGEEGRKWIKKRMGEGKDLTQQRNQEKEGKELKMF